MRLSAFAPVLTVAALTALAALATPAAADAPPAPRPRMLVLPLPHSHAVDPSIARAFDARLLVALDDTRRVVTVTPSEEPECTSTSCLASMGVAAGAALVVSMTAVHEPDGLTLFGTVVDTRTADAVRRIELTRIDPATLARAAPAELVPQIVAAGPAAAPAPRVSVLGVARPQSPFARAAVQAIQEGIAGYRTFKVVPLESTDRSTLTHRAELVITDLAVVDRRRGLCTWHDGVLVGTFSITDLSNGRAVFTRTVRLAESLRALTSTREEVLDALLEAAVADWVTAFHASGAEARLRRTPRP